MSTAPSGEARRRPVHPIEIAAVFGWFGATTFGGLFPALPRLERILQARLGVNHTQVYAALAVANMVPGPTFLLWAGVVGYGAGGWAGAGAATLALMAPPGLFLAAVLWLIPASLLSGPLAPLIRALTVAVAGVLAGTAFLLLRRSGRSPAGILVCGLCTAALLVRVPVALVVAGGALLGARMLRGSE